MRRRRSYARISILLAAFAVPVLGASCGSGSSGGTGGAGGGAGGGATSSSSAGTTSGLIDGGCQSGDPCGDGGVCAGNTCCDPKLACADACCGAGQVCSFQKCQTPGADCHDPSDCPPGDYCEYSLGSQPDAGLADAGCKGGAALPNGKCLPRPPECAPDAGPMDDGGALSCFEKCEYHPQAAFMPVLKFAWGGQITPPFVTDVMMTPIVIEMDDDDCDGKVTERDIPEILFTTFTGGAYTSVGSLHAISIINGQVIEKWHVDGVLYSSNELAGGDLDGVSGAEVVGCGADGYVYAFKADGSQLWKSSQAVSCYMPSIADLDNDGVPEVVVEGGILDGKTGAFKTAYSLAPSGTNVVSDIDGDGHLDVVSAGLALRSDGSVIANTGRSDDWPAIADFDHDGVPEVVAVDNAHHSILVWHYDANAPGHFVQLRKPTDINAKFATNTCPIGSAGQTTGGGPPTVADFDGDGTPDVGIAGGIGYVVLDGKKLVDDKATDAEAILWAVPTVDCSSAATGSSVFDFDGDGKAEVIYSDEEYLRIFDGKTGNVLFQTCNTTGTLIEYPVIADVDNDGHADIVVVSNAYASGNAEYQCNDGANIAQSGVRVFGDANGTWVRTRRVWNEHPYHITNVEEDGTIPKNELPNWKQPGLNNFRQNKQPGSEFAAPDAVVSVVPDCPGPTALVATVRNVGEAPLPAGVVVGFYEGAPPNGTKLGSASTTKALGPAESEAVVLQLPNPDMGLVNGTVTIYAIVDDTMMPHPDWHECRTDNNVGGPSSSKCNGPK